MMRIGKTAFRSDDIRYMFWSKEGLLVIEFDDGQTLIIKNLTLATEVWECLTQDTHFQASPKDIEWGVAGGKARL